jgi:ketosteroid isomerase-like protein
LVALDNDWSNAAVAKDVDRVVSFYAVAYIGKS